MKNRVLLLVAVATLAITSAYAEDIVISAKKLPNTAQEFLNTHFADGNIVRAVHDREVGDNDYTIWLNDGSKIEFNGKGNWESVENKSAGVGSSVVPVNIKEYITTNYPSLVIVKIEKKVYGYEVELNNDLDLKFDSNGNFQRVDD